MPTKSKNWLIQGQAAHDLWKIMHHEYHCEDCTLCESCRAASDDPMLIHDSSLFLCKDCKVCEKSTSAEMMAALGVTVEIMR